VILSVVWIRLWNNHLLVIAAGRTSLE
jgi:hypothetical protein